MIHLKHDRANADAELIFDKMINGSPLSFKELAHINILVLGAGAFPSFTPLIKTLIKICPKVISLHLTLIEPNESATNQFKNYFSTMQNTINNLTIKIDIHTIDSKSYLTKPMTPLFDLVYFEHPDVSIYSVLLSQFKIKKDPLAVSMQESIPYLNRFIKDNAIIMGSFIFKNDLKELKALLKFCLKIKIFVLHKKHLFSEGRYYSLGLLGIVNKSHLLLQTPKQLVTVIKRDTLLFGIFFSLSVMLFFCTENQVKLISLFLVISQLFYLRYGISGLLIRLLLISMQLILLLLSFH